jgi:uncharacterized protein YbjT (DUF2867 family)
MSKDGKVSFVDIRDIASVAAIILTDDNKDHIGKSYELVTNYHLFQTIVQLADVLITKISESVKT